MKEHSPLTHTSRIRNMLLSEILLSLSCNFNTDFMAKSSFIGDADHLICFDVVLS